MVEAVVEFDYNAKEVDELTIRKGDVITDVRVQPGGWWEGCLHGRRGMFPDNFVKVQGKADIIKTNTMANNEVQLRTSSGRKCKVLFSYQPANDDELELQLNDVIEILDEVEEGWWKGKLRNRVGVFPSNFVTEITDKAMNNGGTGSRKTSATQPPPLSMLRKEENHSSGILISETDSPASPTGPDSGNPNALDVETDAPTLPPKPVKELCRVLFPYDAVNEDELTLKEGDIITIVTRDVQDKGWWKGELGGRVGVFPDNFVALIPQDELPQIRRPDRPPVKVSQAVASNRARDNIVKATNIATVTSTKKPPENTSKPEEKAPPVLSKKPALPPTAKKPQLRPGVTNSVPQPTPPQAAVVSALKRLSNERMDSPEQRLTDLVDGTSSSKMVPSILPSGDMDFDGVERGAMLTHPTASRAKAPGRRLPTAKQSKDMELLGGMVNGNAEHHEHTAENNHNNHTASDAEGPATPGSVSSASSGSVSNRNSKEWEKHKAPWMEELKMSQAAKKGHGAKTPPAPSPSKLEPGRPGTDVTDSPASPTTPEPPKTNAVTFRQNSIPSNNVAIQSITNNAVNTNSGAPSSAMSSGSRPQSVHGEVAANRFSTSPSSGSRPLSMYSPSTNDKPSPAASPATSGGTTVSLKQFLELADKVSNLEKHCELLTRTIEALSLQVKEEREKRFQVQHELEKLTDLVTQV